MSLRTAPLLLLLPIALLGAGCSSSGPSGPAASTASSTGLAGLIVSAVPADFDLRPEAASHTGTTDLAKAARDDGTAGARAALVAAGFRRGYQRLWTDPAGDVVAVQVYQFADARGALAWAHRARTLALHQAARVTSFTVPGLPTSSAGTEVDVEGDTTEQVDAARGGYALQVLCSARRSAGLRARTRRLALAQYVRLGQSR